MPYTEKHHYDDNIIYSPTRGAIRGLRQWGRPMSTPVAPSVTIALGDAEWISPQESSAPAGTRPAQLLRQAFNWSKPLGPERVLAYATAHGIYELFVNGVRVGDQELTPGFTSYRRRLQVQQYDITDLLTEGENVIGAILSDGWFRGRHGFERRADGFGDQTAFLAAVLVQRGDDWVQLLGTGKGWECRESHITRADLMDGQTTDFRRYDSGWASPSPEISPKGWQPVQPSTGELCDDRDRLIPESAPPVRRIQVLHPAEITVPRHGTTVVDFGQNINGWVRLGSLGPKGTRTVLSHGEALDESGLLTTEHLRAFIFGTGQMLPAGQVDEVISGGGDEVFEPRHTTHGFRYVQIEGLDDVSAGDIEAVVVHTDLTKASAFECSDPRINELHRVIDWSFRGNACDVPTDCPQRERSGFTGDWQVFVDTAAFLYDISDFSEKWLQDLAADQWADGRVPTVVPNPAGAGPSGNAFEDMATGSAGWGDAAVLVPWSLWRAYGSSANLARAYPSMKKWVDYAAGAAAAGRHPQRQQARPEPAPHEQYLWDTGFHFGEWLEPDTPPNPDPGADHGIVATAYLYKSALIVAHAASVLDNPTDADHYRDLAHSVGAAWREEYLLPDGRLREESQGHYARALAFGLVPAEVASKTSRRLAELVQANGGRLGTGFLATGLLLPALADHAQLRLAYELLFSTGTPSWLGMIERGATTMWEWWDGVTDQGVRGSLNHYSKGAVGSFLYSHVVGIRLPLHPRPDEAGYLSLDVAPKPGGGITWAKANLETRQGPISVGWKIEEDLFVLDMDLPDHVTARVQLPDGRNVQADGGTWHFESPLGTTTTDQAVTA